MNNCVHFHTLNHSKYFRLYAKSFKCWKLRFTYSYIIEDACRMTFYVKVFEGEKDRSVVNAGYGPDTVSAVFVWIRVVLWHNYSSARGIVSTTA